MSWPEAAPLHGVKVLDLCRIVSGPFATMQLGDLGADVLKIEEPGCGDESRTYGPPFMGGESTYFLSINRNKRSCAIDLKSRSGRDLIIRLATVADVVVENFRPGTLERFGIGFDVLVKENDRLILCSISGFGRTGADAQRPAYDLIVQGESGFMDITGEPDRPPMKAGTSCQSWWPWLVASGVCVWLWPLPLRYSHPAGYPNLWMTKDPFQSTRFSDGSESASRPEASQIKTWRLSVPMRAYLHMIACKFRNAEKAAPFGLPTVSIQRSGIEAWSWTMRIATQRREFLRDTYKQRWPSPRESFRRSP